MAANGGAAARATGGSRLAPAQRSVAMPAREPIAFPNSASENTPIVVARFEDLIALAAQQRDLVVKTALERDLRLVRFEDGKLEVALEPGAAKTLVGDLSRKLSGWTGRRWMVIVSAEQGAPTLRAQAETRKAELKRGVAADPLVQAVLNRFPGAEIVDVRGPDVEPVASAAVAEPPPESVSNRGRSNDVEDEF